MIATASHDDPAFSLVATTPGLAATLTRVSAMALYGALAIVFLWIGAMKFSSFASRWPVPRSAGPRRISC